MYFSVNAGDVSRLWRQRFPDGIPEQITFGPTDEEGIALSADGRSLITSIGRRQSAIWMHDSNGERPLSTEGFAFAPRLSYDGTHLYFLRRSDPTSTTTELRSIDLRSGNSDTLLPGVSIRDFDVSNDGRDIVFSTAAGGESQILIAPIDRHQAPALIARGGDAVSFGPNDDVVFRSLGAQTNTLMRVPRSGGPPTPIFAPILDKAGVSPDGQWAFVAISEPGKPTSVESVVVPVNGGATVKVCSQLCYGRWSHDGRYLYLYPWSGRLSRTWIAVPIPAGRSLPAFAKSGIDLDHLEVLSGTQVIRQEEVAPGPTPSTYAFVKAETSRNLYRIPLH